MRLWLNLATSFSLAPLRLAVYAGVFMALLGAAGLGDIGQHFPDSDPAWRGAASGQFVSVTLDRLKRAGKRPIATERD